MGSGELSVWSMRNALSTREYEFGLDWDGNVWLST